MTRRSQRPQWVARTEEAIDEHTAPAPGERKYATGDEAHTVDREVLRHEQQEEIAHSWYGLGFLSTTLRDPHTDERGR